LLELLDDAVEAPLTIVAAPAGSGKTSLLASWVAETTTPNAWLALDEADHDAVQVWMGLVAALEAMAPGCGTNAITALQRPGGVLEAVGALLDDLETQDLTAGVLIIDDFHQVEDDPVVITSLAVFVQHLPVWLHVVLLSRRVPELPVNRLRARGLLGEVHFAELKFSQQEAEEMLSRLAPTLTPEQIRAGARKAGGWAASIQLTALAARSNRAQPDVVTSSEGDLLVEHYLWQEVLADESPDLIETLVATSVVERVDLELARVLTGRADVGVLLARAEDRGLFVNRLDPSGYYRIHALVRDVLRADLAKQAPERLREQHLRAARWYEERQQIPLALEHLLLGGEPRDALRVLAANNAALYDSGLEATIARTIGSVPLNVAMADAEAMLEFTWCHLLVNRRLFLEYVDRLTVSVGQSDDLEPMVRGRLTMLRSIAATVQGDWVKGGRLAREAIDQLGPLSWRDPLGRFAWNMISREIALSERWDESAHEVQEAVRALSIDPERLVALDGTRALAEALAGRPVDGLRIAAGVRQAAKVASMTILGGELSAAEAIAHRELGDWTTAHAELIECIRQAADPVPYCRLIALLELTMGDIDEGDLALAETRFDEAFEIVTTDLPGPGAREMLARAGVVLSLATNRLDDARGWSEQLTDPFWSRIGGARVLLAESKKAEAFALLEQAEPRCVRHEVIRDLLLARAVDGQQPSQKYVVSAVERAAANELLQTVASEGAEIVQAAEAAAWHVPAAWLDRLRRAAVPGVAKAADRSAKLLENLTEREREVLRLLPSRLTLREIAGELFISVNTLKFHLKVLYRKLECNSRAEAAEVARAMARRRRPRESFDTR
jgi:ATP/maltotriose-dependent transcriptional regulator MalT